MSGMSGGQHRRVLALPMALTVGISLMLAVAQSAGAATALTGRRICVSRAHPRLATRMSRRIAGALGGRYSAVGLKVTDDSLRLTCRLNQGDHFDAASVIKATIISALLLKVGGHRHMTASQRSLAWRMITESDNAAATQLWNEVGIGGMQRFLNRAQMKHTILSGAWGLSLVTAQDEVTLLRLLMNPGRVLSTPSRRYVLYLMAHVVPGQRWGVPAGAPRDVTVHVKNGWLPYPSGSDWHINSIGAFTGRGIGYQIAMLTSGNPSMTYGIDTIEAACRIINRNLSAF